MARPPSARSKATRPGVPSRPKSRGACSMSTEPAYSTCKILRSGYPVLHDSWASRFTPSADRPMDSRVIMGSHRNSLVGTEPARRRAMELFFSILDNVVCLAVAIELVAAALLLRRLLH